MSTAKNRAERDRKRRKRLRDRLAAEGASPALIEKALQQMRWDDLVRRHGLAEARRIVNLEWHGCDLDDRGFRPKASDSLLTGVGRPSGIAAKVAGRRETITRFQYRQMVGK